MKDNGNKAIGLSLLLIIFIWGVNGIYLSALSQISPAAFWAADLMQWIVVPGALSYFLATKYSILPKQYGFASFSESWVKVFVLGLIAALTFYISFFWVRDFSWRFLGHPTGFFSLGSVFPSGALGTVIWLYSAVSAGLVESALFIGLPWLLWSRLNLDSPFVFSFLSALIFSSVHWEQGPHVVIGALAFGLVACAWFFRLRTLWPIVIGHVIVDLIAFH